MKTPSRGTSGPREEPRTLRCCSHFYWLLALSLGACAGSVGARGSDSGAAADAEGGVGDAARRGRREVCNGLDDDLDGRVDEGCPLRLTTEDAHDLNPTVDGDLVVWTRVERTARGDTGVLLARTLPDGPERRLADSAQYPSVSGQRVAFLRGTSIQVLQLGDGSSFEVPAAASTFRQAPYLSGDTVAWSQLQDGDEDYDVFAYDLAGRTLRQLTHDGAIQNFPLVEGDTVLWGDDRRGHHTVGLLHLFDLFAASLAAPEPPRALTERTGDLVYNYAPYALQGGRVLSTETRGPLADANAPHTLQPVLLDVRTGARTELGPALPAEQGCLPRALWQHLVVLECAPLGDSDLVLLDLRTMQRRYVTNYPRRSTRPRLRGSWLVWQDDRNDQWDLYAMDLSDLDAGDFSPEGVTP